MALAIILIAATFYPFNSNAAYYVRAGAAGSGSGSDWANAYTSLPATLQRGETYYVATGSYAAYDFDTPVSGTSIVTIQKATTSNHGTETGWDSSYGIGQAEFPQLSVSTSYLVFDGVVGGGPSSWKAGHGFKLAASYEVLLLFPTTVSHVTVRHTEFAYPSTEVDDTLADDHIYGALSSLTDFTLEYCYMHDTSRTFILSRGWTDVLVQYNYFARNRYTEARHSELWSDHNGVRYVIRYNIMEDIEGTGVTVLLFGNGIDWEIYGNVVFWSGDPNYDGNGNGIFTTASTGANAINWRVYNNTVVDCKGRGDHTIYNGSGNETKNNLWYNCSSLGGHGATTADYNWYVNSDTPPTLGSNDAVATLGDIFADSASNDFRITSSSPNGAGVEAAGHSYHVDAYGYTRGADGWWDRGAYEFVGGMYRFAPSFNLRRVSWEEE